MFCDGLPDNIRIDVELQVPQELQRAMALAHRYECAPPRPLRLAPHARHNSICAPSTSCSACQHFMSSDCVFSCIADRSTRVFRCLSPAEMTEHRRQGLCYNCDEKYVHDHKCPYLFYLEVVDPEDEIPNLMDEPLPAKGNEPFISLDAITGIRDEDTMQVRVTLGTHEFMALLDLGSITNFIGSATGSCARLRFQSGKNAYVRITNHDKVDCRGLACDVLIRIGQEEFLINYFSIPLDCYKMVLGMSFLLTLGLRRSLHGLLASRPSGALERSRLLSQIPASREAWLVGPTINALERWSELTLLPFWNQAPSVEHVRGSEI